MTIDRLRTYCLGLPEACEDFPFGEDVLVFKVAGKMFGMVNFRALPFTMNLKCDPERSADLRERYESISPGYHMNKRHWNTIVMDGNVPDSEALALVDHSYGLVVQGLPRKDRERLQG